MSPAGVTARRPTSTVLVVLPTYNEVESLRGVVARIRIAIPEADLLIVDDDSPDGTGGIADDLARDDTAVRVLHRPAKDGLGSAYLAGFARAADEGYRFVVEIDADGSHDPGELPRMVSLADRDGADLVIGSRWVPGGSVVNWPWLRRAISRGGNRYARAVLRSRVQDLTAGYRVYRTAALDGVDGSVVSSHGYCFQVELAWRIERRGGRIIEHPIAFVERATGRSKMHVGIVAEALWRVTLWGVVLRLGGQPLPD
jgi:dolichol-phosphate mannosyltransferase